AAWRGLHAAGARGYPARAAAGPRPRRRRFASIPPRGGSTGAGEHAPGLDHALVPGKGLAQQVGRVAPRAFAVGALEIVLEQRPERGVRALFDDAAGALAGRQATQVRQALFGHDHHGVVLGVVHVAGHRDDARDQAALGGAGRHEHRQVAVAGEIAGAADAVHDPAPGDVGGVDVAVQVGLDHAVHGDAAEAADQLRVVGDLLRAQDDPLAVEVDVAVE